MPQVSKNRLSKQQWDEIWQVMLEAFSRLTYSQSVVFADSLFTKTEKIMLAKRLFVLILYLNKIEAKDISRILKMSKSTVYKLVAYMEPNPEFKKLVKKLSNIDKLKLEKTKRSPIFDYLDNLAKSRQERWRIK